MLPYFILFLTIGIILGLFFTVKGASNIILITVIGWAFVQGPWALAALGEMILGFAAGRWIYESIKHNR